MRAEEYFAREWPNELPRLRRMLARSGVPLDAIDDVLQEAALRLYTAWGRVFEDRPLRPLLNTIVLNAARDYHRRTHYEVRAVAEFPEGMSTEPLGAEQVVMARLELARAGRALSALTDQQRHVVLSAVTEELAGEERGRVRAPASTRMQITRARRRLAEVLEITAAGIGLGWGFLGRRKGAKPAMAVGALALVSVALLIPGRGAPTQATITPVAPAAGIANASATPGWGRAEWRYDLTAPAVSYAPGLDGSAGTSRWSWEQTPWLSVDAFGARAGIGGDTTDPRCVLALAGRVTVKHACLPVVTATDAP